VSRESLVQIFGVVVFLATVLVTVVSVVHLLTTGAH
jgi:hypothetical protein